MHTDSTLAPVAPQTSTTHATESSSVEKVIEVVEPVVKHEDTTRVDLVKDPLAELFVTIQPTKEPFSTVVFNNQEVATVVSNKEPLVSSLVLQPTTIGPIIATKVFPEKPLDIPVEIEVFEANRSTPLEHETTISPAVSHSIPNSPTTKAPREVSSTTTGPAHPTTTVGPERPFKSFLKKADDFIERNLVNFKRLLSP